MIGTDRSAAYFGWNSGTQRFELSAGSPFLEKFTRVVHPFNIGMTPLLALGGNAQVDIYRRSGSTVRMISLYSLLTMYCSLLFTTIFLALMM
jgi:hypothetical protein